jgi:hypothetical protein
MERVLLVLLAFLSLGYTQDDIAFLKQTKQGNITQEWDNSIPWWSSYDRDNPLCDYELACRGFPPNFVISFLGNSQSISVSQTPSVQFQFFHSRRCYCREDRNRDAKKHRECLGSGRL